MEANSRALDGWIGWTCVVVASFVLGAALSSIASTLGLADAEGDRRGEWAAVTIPALLLVAGASGVFGLRCLGRLPRL